MHSIGWPEILVVIVYITIIVIPFWRIFVKAGFSKWLAFVMRIPLVNLILLYYFAFTDWPALKKL